MVQGMQMHFGQRPEASQIHQESLHQPGLSQHSPHGQALPHQPGTEGGDEQGCMLQQPHCQATTATTGAHEQEQEQL